MQQKIAGSTTGLYPWPKSSVFGLLDDGSEGGGEDIVFVDSVHCSLWRERGIKAVSLGLSGPLRAPGRDLFAGFACVLVFNLVSVACSVRPRARGPN